MEKNEEYKPYTAKRWTEIPDFRPTGVIVESTPEQRNMYRKRLEELMKENGVLKPGETLDKE